MRNLSSWGVEFIPVFRGSFVWFAFLPLCFLPVHWPDVVLRVRGAPLLHSSRVAETCENCGSLGEKFTERHRSAALIAIFTHSAADRHRATQNKHTKMHKHTEPRERHHPTVASYCVDNGGGEAEEGVKGGTQRSINTKKKNVFQLLSLLFHLFI